MAKKKSGTIINISSVSDRTTAPVAITCKATKHAVRALIKSFRESEPKNGIRFINIAPAYVKTNIHTNMEINFAEYSERLGNLTS